MTSNDGQITVEERERALKLLDDSERAFLAEIDAVSDVQWCYVSSPVAWSVAQIAEHILLSQNLIFSIIQRTLAGEPDPDWKTKTAGKQEVLERILPERVGRARAPERLMPTGKMTREEVRDHFRKTKSAVEAFVKTTEQPLKAYTHDNPFPVFGTLSAYDWLLYIPLHTTRHLRQIAEVKSSETWPK
ncbi:MAG TPA: DinB family protein [Blastocatellia bacterium]|nr:DinB family protein [Blastocatellia bacterium]